jgi:hypothetical protein
MPQPVLEQISVQPVLDISAVLNKIIKENNLSRANEKVQDEKLAIRVMQHMVKIQSSLMTNIKQSRQKISVILNEAKEDIAQAVGGKMPEDIAQLLNKFAANSESIENYFV